MSEMIRRLLRQRFENLGILIALAVLGLMAAVGLAASGGRRGLETAFLGLVLLAGGSVSRDASGGALQMILARPIRRTSYLFGRYLGVLLAYAIFLAATAAAALLLARLLVLLARPQASAPVALPVLAITTGSALLDAILFVAVLLFFSTFLPGYADVLAYFLLFLLLTAPEGIAEGLRKPSLAEFARASRQNILPRVPWERVFGEGEFPQAEVGRYVLAVAVFLALAAFVFSRREFAYGQD